jgi:putative transposase
VAPLCKALHVSRATLYRAWAREQTPHILAPRPTPARALCPAERQQVLDLLHDERFIDLAPHEVYATLLDKGIFLCSVRTMYRILDAHNEIRERRNQARHPVYAKPELLATRPNELWSWDITKLLGPAKWTYFYLYVILDVFSRYVVGWMLASQETASLAKRLIEQTCRKQLIVPEQLTLHADRGSSMNPSLCP